MTWRIVYKKAINPDGSLLFPERLTREFLDDARKRMGSILFANQYQNEIIPDDEKRFKASWLRYIDGHTPPPWKLTFGFIDPAIGQKNNHDYTAITVVDVDHEGKWYLRLANRARLTPTEIIAKMFDVCAQFNINCLGVETVAYQEALLYFLDEEMKRRQKVIPVTGVNQSGVSKEVRILGLVPRFEWGKIFVERGLTDFEDEYNSFPRAAHDDIMDALASIESIVHYPKKPEVNLNERPHSQHSPTYESWYIRSLSKRQSSSGD